MTGPSATQAHNGKEKIDALKNHQSNRNVSSFRRANPGIRERKGKAQSLRSRGAAECRVGDPFHGRGTPVFNQVAVAYSVELSFWILFDALLFPPCYAGRAETKDPDNPAVQLQGPFVIKKLIPPPAHRNVVMIAAGTGINPMVQQIRDYLALSR